MELSNNHFPFFHPHHDKKQLTLIFREYNDWLWKSANLNCPAPELSKQVGRFFPWHILPTPEGAVISSSPTAPKNQCGRNLRDIALKGATY